MMPPDQRQPNDFPEFLLDSRVSPAMERHYLAWRSFDQGSGVWASVETVAKKLRVDRTTVQRNLRSRRPHPGQGAVPGPLPADQLLPVPHPRMVG